MPNVRDAEQIRAIINAREIKFLFHFTQLSNLENILERGILTRVQIIEQALNCAVNDELRLDGHPNATCCSIGFPNYKMFWPLRNKPENAEVKWVVIGLSPNILLEKDCVFCPTNAASNEITCRDVNDFKGAAALESMFAEVEGKPTRLQMNLPDTYTTNPQAEVLVFNCIEQRYIIGVGTNCVNTANEWKARKPNLHIIPLPNAFKGRYDHQNW